MSTEFPAWRYGPGAEGEKHEGKPAFEHDGKWVFKKLCRSADDVPSGWVDSPALVGGEAPKKRGRPPKASVEETEGADSE